MHTNWEERYSANINSNDIITYHAFCVVGRDNPENRQSFNCKHPEPDAPQLGGVVSFVLARGLAVPQGAADNTPFFVG